MSRKAKMILGLTGLCLLTAAVATLLTTAILMRFVFSSTGSTTDMTSGQPQLSYRPSATPTVIPSPTPVVTDRPASPTPVPTQPVATETGPTPSVTPEPEPEPSDSSETTLPDETSDPSTPVTTESSTGETQDEQSLIWQQYDLLETIYEKVSPSVVGIEVEVEETVTAVRRTNSGSGLIMNEDGVIVTNSSILSIAVDKYGNVFEHAEIRVYILGRDRPYFAKLIGRDPLTGIAVLQINPGYRVLQPAVFDDTPELNVGQMILAIGFPDALEESGHLYTGMISALNRPVQLEDGTSLQMIQTDARISQACSGGPLLNLNGEVIGLTNCGLVRSAYDTQSYALPAVTAQMVVSDLTSQGYVGGRSWLGVSVLVEETFLQLQTLYNYPNGLYIADVIDGSPAYTADLRRGDIITRINDNPIDTSMDMSYFLQTQPVGSMLRLQVYRRDDNRYHEFRVYLQEYIQ